MFGVGVGGFAEPLNLWGVGALERWGERGAAQLDEGGARFGGLSGVLGDAAATS